MKKTSGIEQLLTIMAKLRSPSGCPWDREQDHGSIRFHAVEEVYELIDAIEAGDDHELQEELGDFSHLRRTKQELARPSLCIVFMLGSPGSGKRTHTGIENVRLRRVKPTPS